MSVDVESCLLNSPQYFTRGLMSPRELARYYMQFDDLSGVANNPELTPDYSNQPLSPDQVLAQAQAQDLGSRQQFHSPNQNWDQAQAQAQARVQAQAQAQAQAQEDSEMLDVGRLPFVLKKKLAEGSYGAVYKAELYRPLQSKTDLSHIPREELVPSGLYIAAKVLICQPEDRLSVGPLVEVDILSRLRHPNLLAAYSITRMPFNESQETENGVHPAECLALTMPLARCDVGRYVQRIKLNFQHKVYIIWQTLLGLNCLHQEQIIHADIKLENLLITDTQELTVVLADFGLAQYADHSGQARTDQELVTITYRAPEAFSSRPKYTFGLDIWALGICFLHLLTGKTEIFARFNADDPNEARMLQYLKTNFPSQNERKRRATLLKFLRPTNLTKQEKGLAISFLTRCLEFDVDKRAGMSELLQHSMFEAYQSQPKVEGAGIYPSTVCLNPLKITLEAYLSLDFLFQLARTQGVRAETGFLALDLFHRSLSYVYQVMPHFQVMDNIEWSDGGSETEIYGLMVLTVIWVSIRTVEDHLMTSEYICELVKNRYSVEQVLEMERRLLLSWDGIIYRTNPFRWSTDWAQLVVEMDHISNLYTYPYLKPQPATWRDPSTVKDVEDDVYRASFSQIYQKTEYYRLRCELGRSFRGRLARTRAQEAIARRRFGSDRAQVFPGDQ